MSAETKAEDVLAPPPSEEQAHATHPLERALLVLLGFQLIFQPWALGNMYEWSQVLSGFLALAAFVVAIIPRSFPARTGGHAPYVVRTLPRLFKFPIFWFGLAFLCYLLVQGLNVAWRQVPAGKEAWLRAAEHLEWLPSGVAAPFRSGNTWRSLLVDGTAWLSACAAWTGFTRRKTVRRLLIALVFNGALLATIGILQRGSQAHQILWSWTPPAGYFVSTFIYRNHAGAYFDLILAISIGLTLVYWHREDSGRDRAGFKVVLGCCSLLIIEVVVISYSRGSLLLMGLLLILVATLLAVRKVLSGPPRFPSWRLIAVAVPMAAMVFAGIFILRAQAVFSRLETLPKEIMTPSTNVRVLLAKATWDMIGDHPAFGWGSNSFQYIFPGYQARFPVLRVTPDGHQPLRFEHAHNDYLELIAETGWGGSALIAAGALCTLGGIWRARQGADCLTWLLLAGGTLTAIHATFDLPFANPAVLTTWCVVWAILHRWLLFNFHPTSGAY